MFFQCISNRSDSAVVEVRSVEVPSVEAGRGRSSTWLKFDAASNLQPRAKRNFPSRPEDPEPKEKILEKRGMSADS